MKSNNIINCLILFFIVSYIGAQNNEDKVMNVGSNTEERVKINIAKPNIGDKRKIKKALNLSNLKAEDITEPVYIVIVYISLGPTGSLAYEFYIGDNKIYHYIASSKGIIFKVFDKNTLLKFAGKKISKSFNKGKLVETGINFPDSSKIEEITKKRVKYDSLKPFYEILKEDE